MSSKTKNLPKKGDIGSIIYVANPKYEMAFSSYNVKITSVDSQWVRFEDLTYNNAKCSRVISDFTEGRFIFVKNN